MAVIFDVCLPEFFVCSLAKFFHLFLPGWVFIAERFHSVAVSGGSLAAGVRGLLFAVASLVASTEQGLGRVGPVVVARGPGCSEACVGSFQIQGVGLVCLTLAGGFFTTEKGSPFCLLLCFAKAPLYSGSSLTSLEQSLRCCVHPRIKSLPSPPNKA